MRNHWYLPFLPTHGHELSERRAPHHHQCATPIDDGQIQLVQLLYRNDTEADCPAQLLIDWDAKIIAEDREILESTDPDAAIDLSRRTEATCRRIVRVS